MSKKLTLKEWREKRGMTQLELAFATGFSDRTIINYEKAGVLSDVRYKNIKKICDALDIKMDDILIE